MATPTINLLGNVLNTGLSTANSVAGAVSDLFTPSPSTYSGSKRFQQRYNDLLYNIDLYLDNSNQLASASEANRYYINPAAVLNLTIDSALTNWVTEGSITFMYLPDDATGKQHDLYGQGSSSYVQGAKENNELLKSYQFRADGFDVLRIALYPMSSPTDKNANELGDTLEIAPEDPKWTLSHLFSVYEVQDVNDIPGIKGPLASYMKCIKLFFRDLRYQILQTTNIEYSTSLSPDGSSDTGLANGYAPQKTLQTGSILKEILIKVLGDSTNGGDPSFEPVTSDWEPGASEIFYTSPAQWSAMDDVNYVLGQHVSSTDLADGIKDVSLLYTKRSNTKTFIDDLCLGPISKFFETALEGDKPGVDQIEHFFVTSHTDSKNQANKKYMSPFSDGTDRDLKTFKYGQIISYSFVDMSPEINSALFTSTPVYSVDIGKRIFEAKFTNNTPEAAREAIGNSYITKVFNEGGSPTQLFLPTIHQQKKSRNMFPAFSLNGEQLEQSAITRQKNGISQLLYTGLFQNACICFTTFGLTHREPGKFIAIDKADKAEDTDYNNKVFGQWFILRVVHSFEAGAYMNAIYAIKLHRVKQAELTFPNTI